MALNRTTLLGKNTNGKRYMKDTLLYRGVLFGGMNMMYKIGVLTVRVR